MADRRITLEVTEAAMSVLAHEGYDPGFGARPLKRVIQREISDRAATLILEGNVGDGDTIVVDAADAEQGGITVPRRPLRSVPRDTIPLTQRAVAARIVRRLAITPPWGRPVSDALPVS